MALDVGNLRTAVSRLKSYKVDDRPARHQAIVLLWAAGRARQGYERLDRWSVVRDELHGLLARYNLPGSQPTPHYPFVALNSSALWEVEAPSAGEVPPAHGSVSSWLSANDPAAGLTDETYRLIAEDERARGVFVGAILNRYFDGDRAADLLRDVGLLYGSSTAEGTWNLRPGDVARRQTIHDVFDGQRQGGIATPEGNARVLLFVDPAGAEHGYDYDGPKDDGSYHYTGQGRHGDQGFTASNSAVLDPNRELHVFETAAPTVVVYLGRFDLDKTEPYYKADAPDDDKELRTVIVFRLWAATAQHTASTVAAHVSNASYSTEVPIESHKTAKSKRKSPHISAEAERREAALIARYETWLAGKGQTLVGNRIFLGGRAGEMRTDLFVKEIRELTEAKSSGAREYVREAIGQLFDYRRYVSHDHLAVLLPSRPAEDLVELLTSLQITCVYECGDGTFKRVDATAN